PHEWRGHRYLCSIRHDEIHLACELLNVTENVVPSPAVQACAVMPQFVENLLHLEARQNMFDEHSRFDSSLRDVQRLLGSYKNVIPQARFEIMLQLGQIKINP